MYLNCSMGTLKMVEVNGLVTKNITSWSQQAHKQKDTTEITFVSESFFWGGGGFHFHFEKKKELKQLIDSTVLVFSGHIWIMDLRQPWSAEFGLMKLNFSEGAFVMVCIIPFHYMLTASKSSPCSYLYKDFTFAQSLCSQCHIQRYSVCLCHQLRHCTWHRNKTYCNCLNSFIKFSKLT